MTSRLNMQPFLKKTFMPLNAISENRLPDRLEKRYFMDKELKPNQ